MAAPAVEALGYLASALIVLSLAMTSVVRLRIVSLIGTIAFTAYGLLIGSWPVAISNAIIVVINIVYLRRILGWPRDLDAVPMDVASPFLADFLASHLTDIRRTQPEFEEQPGDTAFVLMRDGMPAGALVGVRRDGALHLTLDYVLPAYRDSRLGRWLYVDNPALLRRHGITRLSARPATQAHRDYLLGVGFTRAPDATLVKEFA